MCKHSTCEMGERLGRARMDCTVARLVFTEAAVAVVNIGVNGIPYTVQVSKAVSE